MKIYLCLLCSLVIHPLYSQSSLKKELRAVISGKQAQVGIAVLYDGRILTAINNRDIYPMMSTFKFPLGLTVLHKLDTQHLPLDTVIFISASALKPDTYSPLKDAHPEGNFNMSVRDLLFYSISLSDNNACDILLKWIGGTGCVQNYLRNLGIRNMQIEVTEDQMHQDPATVYLNKTRPSDATFLLEKFIRQELLSPVYQEFMEKIMIATETGPDKLKGLLPPGTVVGHKTGSSDRHPNGKKAGDNDMGFVRLPNGKYYTIAVFIKDSAEDDQTNAALIARISRIVYDHYSQ